MKMSLTGKMKNKILREYWRLCKFFFDLDSRKKNNLFNARPHNEKYYSEIANMYL